METDNSEDITERPEDKEGTLGVSKFQLLVTLE
jgi:hypothetical protein